MKKLLIAGTHSGVGKTTITLGIMQALKKRGLAVQPYKVGPDYIDPAYHSFITGRPSRNLDAYMLEEEQNKYLFSKASSHAQISVIEGVMGLYDGKGASMDACSSGQMAKWLKAPVILVINGKGMSASSAAMVLGYKQLDPEVNLAGVIVNQVKSQRHYELIKEAVEKYTSVPVLGYFPPSEAVKLPSRHLGLVPSGEIEALEEKLEDIGAIVEAYIDVERLLELSESPSIHTSFTPKVNLKLGPKTIGVAYDKAFNFYYPDNLELLSELGVKIEYFSPLTDKKLPNCDWLYMGGGFPEVFAKELEANVSMRQAIKAACEAGLPIYGECGGLMYLGEELITGEGESFKMVGALKGKSKMTATLKRFGYCCGKALEDNGITPKGGMIRGHEFHHSEFETSEQPLFLMKKEKGEAYYGGYKKNNLVASYLHLHFYSHLEVLERFLNKEWA